MEINQFVAVLVFKTIFLSLKKRQGLDAVKIMIGPIFVRDLRRRSQVCLHNPESCFLRFKKVNLS